MCGFHPALAHVQERLDLICREWKLPHPQTTDHEALVDFALAHDISLDWLFLGKLTGLHRMTRARRRAAFQRRPSPFAPYVVSYSTISRLED